ncbi:MAG: PEP/pyruvate-binding domain-containing protein [Ancalomicrobiaceae bacterium]|nr:PEP/pyruvate-binding domain-containing protein [Ancalomicrobiaceae bacterium]
MTGILDCLQAVGTSVAVVGGKAFALAELAAAGFDIPPFAVATPAAFDGDGRLTAEARHALAAAVARLPGSRFAVRSSARAEDGAEDSHAGQFLTLLDVERNGIATAAEQVFASGGSASVVAYRAARGHADVDMPSVIVQAMVEARVAGVAFAADPVSRRRDRVVVSAAVGLGDRLVGGEVDGETWVLMRPNLEAVERPDAAEVLSEPEARLVARLCLAVSDRKDVPQDIEWAFAAGADRPTLLQARPITTPLLPAGPFETRLTVLDNSNIVESYPGLVSPLTFSFASQAYARVYRTFLELIGVSDAVIASHAAELANMLTRLDGRIYYNLGNWYRLLSLLPFFSSNRRHMETMMGVAAPLPEEIMAGVAPTTGVWAGARMVARLGLAALRLPRIKTGFMARIGEAVPPRRDWGRLGERPLSELAGEYRRVEAALLDRWDAPIVNDFLCMMAFGGSRALIERWAGAGGLALHNDVMIGQGDIVSAEPARLIRAMGDIVRQSDGAAEALASDDTAAIGAFRELSEKLQAYIERFGDRRIGELKLEAPTLDEDPSPLLRAVAAAAHRQGRAPDRRDARQALSQLFAGRPLQRLLVSLALSYTKARVRDRENLRFERTRIFGYARRVVRAMGGALTATGLIDQPDDVFLMTIEELLSVAEGNAVTGDLKDLVALRRREFEAAARLTDPPERILLRGSVVDAGSRLAGSRSPTSRDDASERHGTACGGGTVKGLARVIRNPAEEQIEAGEILVARHTDPGWISHFANAAAVVAERGSVLSHSAIVSRELGIPCVVAVGSACDWIATGDLIEVDGSGGWVRKLR